MLVYDLCTEMLLSNPDARGLVLAADLWARHVAEQAADLVARGIDVAGIRFYCEGRPVLCDPALRAGTAEYVSWPSGVPG